MKEIVQTYIWKNTNGREQLIKKRQSSWQLSGFVRKQPIKKDTEMNKQLEPVNYPVIQMSRPKALDLQEDVEKDLEYLNRILKRKLVCIDSIDHSKDSQGG